MPEALMRLSCLLKSKKFPDGVISAAVQEDRGQDVDSSSWTAGMPIMPLSPSITFRKRVQRESDALATASQIKTSSPPTSSSTFFSPKLKLEYTTVLNEPKMP